ncbi:S8 family serine peptidase [Crocinitomix sp.]|nr:S8 family serine peptidase [Crocinitomix sp.]
MRLKTILFCLLFTSLSFGQNQNYVPGELLIQLNSSVLPSEFSRVFESDQTIGITGIEELSGIARIYRIRFTDSSIDLDRIQQILYGYPQVNIVQKNHYVSERETIPNDALFGEQWGFKNTGLDGGYVDADIDATDAWDITTGGVTTHNDTIVACIIEGAGADISHVDFAGNLWRNYGEIPDDGIDNDGNGYIDDFEGWNVQTDTDVVGSGSHGTRVSGLVGAKGDNSIGIAGVNWNVKMMFVKGQVASDEASVITAYSYPLKMRQLYNDTYGEAGAFVVVTNASWGIDNGDPEDSPLWCAMYDTLGTYGILNVGATTNNNVNVDEVGDLPTTCTSDYLIGVTMTNNKDLRAGSGYGMISVDLGAPGSNMKVTAPGNSYTSSSGTSFAAPIVTGAIALAYSSPCADFINYSKFDPAGAALLMKEYILDGVDAAPGLVDDVLTGGRLNVFNTINLLLDGCDDGACLPPFYMRANDISDTSAFISWDGFSSDYIVTVVDENGFESTAMLFGEFELNLDTLNPCTSYTITIEADCGVDGLSDPSFPIVFRTDGCCTNPPVSIVEKTEESLLMEWPEILYATNYNLRYSPIGEEDWIEFSDVSSPFEIDGLELCQDYDVQIYTVCDDSTRGYSDSYVFKTLGCGACTELDYCPVIGANDNLEWIDTIEINGAIKGTGANDGWYQSEQVITALAPGESYNIRIVPGYAGGAFTEHYSVYIDFDQNGVFNIPFDRVIGDFATDGTVNETFNIPPGATLGITRIRIAMRYNFDPVPCPVDSFSGEYEDYCVYIGEQSGIEEITANIVIYPNPVTDIINIKSDEQISGIVVYSNDGKQVLSVRNYSNEGISMAHLSPGIYIVQVSTESGLTTKKIVKN